VAAGSEQSGKSGADELETTAHLRLRQQPRLGASHRARRSKRWREAGDAAHRLLMFEFLTTCKRIGWISVAAAIA
jgi:hypothetical protein